MSSQVVQRERPRSEAELFLTFTKLALQGFGGVLAIVQRVLCDEKRWLTHEEFLETLAVAQVLPGPNVCNVSLMLGDRFFGLKGALSALAGMLVVPATLVLSIAAVAAPFAQEPMVRGALRGVAAVTAGMFIGTAVKLAGALRKSPLERPALLTIFVAMFSAIALLRLPLLWTMLVVGGGAWAYAFARLRRAAPRADAADPPSGPRA
jgi:chromate transporter